MDTAIAALRAFARHGMTSKAFEEMVSHADLAEAMHGDRFVATQQLLAAVAGALSNELILLAEGLVWELVDPARRIACGVRLYLQAAREFPFGAQLVAAAGMHALGVSSRLHDVLPSDVADGHRVGRFAPIQAEAAVDLVGGSTLAALARMGTGAAPADLPEKVAAAVLRGLGVPGLEAERLVRIDLPRLQPAPHSLLARSRAAPATP
jgi:hypothetical protein